MATLSRTQVDSFRDDGFLVVADLLNSDEVSRIADAARAEFETHRYVAAKTRFPAPTKYVLSEDSLRLPDIRLVVDHPRIVAAATELLEDEVCISAFVIYSMPPGTAGTGGDYQRTHELAHCDYKPFRPVGSSLRWLFAIVPLVDYTEEVGPLLVSPGSHKIPELTRHGRVTHVRRARADELPAFVDTRLRRGQVAFMDMFTWHQAYGNRSDQLRFGVYNKYRARSAPPGCGPYLFRDSSAALFGTSGELLANHAPGRIAETRLLVEEDDRFLVLDSTVPGGVAQPGLKRAGTDDDNVIAHLLDSVEPQLGSAPPWVSYVGDYPLGAAGTDRCRVYGCPRDALPDSPPAVPGARWLTADQLAGATGHAYLSTAAECWLRDPVLRGIGQSYAQANVPR